MKLSNAACDESKRRHAADRLGWGLPVCLVVMARPRLPWMELQHRQPDRNIATLSLLSNTHSITQECTKTQHHTARRRQKAAAPQSHRSARSAKQGTRQGIPVTGVHT